MGIVLGYRADVLGNRLYRRMLTMLAFTSGIPVLGFRSILFVLAISKAEWIVLPERGWFNRGQRLPFTLPTSGRWSRGRLGWFRCAGEGTDFCRWALLEGYLSSIR